MGGAYYNENNPFAAQWLRNLVDDHHIAWGIVDERSIADVHPDDFRSYTQCHFFAGIGIWSSALHAAGWPDDKEVWTGSCPCQPFSTAGKRRGHADERHLWPAFYSLIVQCRPATVLGEQVAGKDARGWLAAVRTDLEGAGYAVGAADLCAAGAGAAHIRQRLYWVADAESQHNGRRASRTRWRAEPANSGASASAVADADNARSQGRGQPRNGSDQCSPGSGSMAGWDWIICTDGKTRPTQPGVFPLVNDWRGSSRVAVLRAAGNAIHKDCATEFIRAVMEVGHVRAV
jgi:DNA (cytosine-5)-methyltransferase 1